MLYEVITKLTASATGTWMNGYLDDAAMFNFELSKDQIALIMAVGVKDFATGIKSNTSASTASVLNNGSRTPVIALSRAAIVDIFDITGKMVFSVITSYSIHYTKLYEYTDFSKQRK